MKSSSSIVELNTESGMGSFLSGVLVGRDLDTGEDGAVLGRVLRAQRSILRCSSEFSSMRAFAVSSAATARESSLRLLSSIAAMVSSTTFITARAW